MADSNITKRALAAAFKSLMEEMPFSKITVAMICEKCDMNRKSFYYHFEDKYDLVNWIFDMDFIEITKTSSDDKWAFIEAACSYFYENKNYYREILKIRGQNSFVEHMSELISPILENKIKGIIKENMYQPICVIFIRDGILSAVGHWIKAKEDLPPKEFVALMKNLVLGYALKVCEENASDIN